MIKKLILVTLLCLLPLSVNARYEKAEVLTKISTKQYKILSGRVAALEVHTDELENLIESLKIQVDVLSSDKSVNKHKGLSPESREGKEIKAEVEGILIENMHVY